IHGSGLLSLPIKVSPVTIHCSKRGREIECKRRSGTVKTPIWSIHCDTARFKDYEPYDLKAFDTVTQK
ncbi:MAG: hypothetical protein VXZ99_14345, partial [Pseudomonadota bacterium]|nr:hypothetical protein [Pseudomonadota bacterium]